MYCPSCGAWNPDDSRFCSKCGRPVQTTTGAPPRVGGGGAQTNRGGLCLIALLAGILIALGAVAVGAFVLRDQLASIWPRPAATPTNVLAFPSPSATSVAAVPTATLLPPPSPSEVQPSATAPAATAALPTTPAQSPTPLPTPTPRQRVFKLVYRDCIPHAQALGSVKGQVFDKKGAVVPGAKVKITIDGYDWKSDANPATTNGEGWYEWILQTGQKVKFVELIVDGQAVSFSPTDLEVTAMGGCFQRVDFTEQ